MMEEIILQEVSQEDEYYNDTSSASFSGLKILSKCETLYRDKVKTKVYEEPDHDYFTYGKLVDAIVSEPEGYITENFVRVERKVNPEQSLKLENDIEEINTEIKEREKKIDEQNFDKRSELNTKLMGVLDKIEAGKLKNAKESTKKKVDIEKLEKQKEKIEKSLTDLPVNKVLQKGIASRHEKIGEIQAKLDAIRELANKTQVSNNIWINAEETALALKAHPAFANLDFNMVTSQQVFRTTINEVPRKGKLDHLKLSPALTKFYAIYAAGQMSLEELQQYIRTQVQPQDLWAIITDVKTCFSMQKLEPFNSHYRGQLGFYQDLVSNVLLIPVENITLRIFAADKTNNGIKMAELFEYPQAVIDELKPDVEAWAQIWQLREQDGAYVSAKAKHGWNQECYTCSECRFSPFSNKPGEPVMVTGPRFKKQ